MNSRQRRKLAAEKHNALMIENEAYREDRVRDPEKYQCSPMRSSTPDERAARRKVRLMMTAAFGLGNYYLD